MKKRLEAKSHLADIDECVTKSSNLNDQKLLVFDDVDQNCWAIGSEETHNLHQTVFESLADAGHDYTVFESDIDYECKVDYDTALGFGLMTASESGATESVLDATHNYAIQNDRKNEELLKPLISQAFVSSHETKKCDHQDYESCNDL